MRVQVFATDRDASLAAAAMVLEELRRTPALVLGLPAGKSPVRLYDELAALCAAGQLDLSRAVGFGVDEFVGVTRAHASSFAQFLERAFFSRVNIPPDGRRSLDGAAADPDAECARYDAAIDAAGGVDVMTLGVGRNGHLGFNEPGESLVARTHRVRLREESREANRSLFGGALDAVPREALTMGMGAILGARRIILLASGEGKALAVERMVRGPLTTDTPASWLQTHRDVDVLLDVAAASRLT